MGLPVRTADDCRDQFQYLKVAHAGKGPWSQTEDQKISDMVKKFGKSKRSMQN